MQAGDIVTADFGVPLGSEAGLVRPAVVVSANAYLSRGVVTVTVVPVTGTTARRYSSDVALDDHGVGISGVAQCRLVTTISTYAVVDTGHENVGPVTLAQIRSVIADLLDLPVGAGP